MARVGDGEEEGTVAIGNNKCAAAVDRAGAATVSVDELRAALAAPAFEQAPLRLAASDVEVRVSGGGAVRTVGAIVERPPEGSEPTVPPSIFGYRLPPAGSNATSTGGVNVDTWARICVVAFVVAAILSVIGGIAVGVEASKETVQGSLFVEQHQRHDAGVLAAWIAAGVVCAFVWIGLAVGIELLRRSTESLDRLVAILSTDRTR